MELFTVSPNKRQLPFAVLLILKGTFLIKQPQYPALPYPNSLTNLSLCLPLVYPSLLVYLFHAVRIFSIFILS